MAYDNPGPKTTADLPMPMKKDEPMELDHVHIEPADNGYIVRVEYHGHKGGSTQYETTRKVFEDSKSLIKFLDDLL